MRLFGHHGNPAHLQVMHAAHAAPGSPEAEVRFWLPKVIQLSALVGTGVEAFWESVQQFRVDNRAGERCLLG